MGRSPRRKSSAPGTPKSSPSSSRHLLVSGGAAVTGPGKPRRLAWEVPGRWFHSQANRELGIFERRGFLCRFVYLIGRPLAVLRDERIKSGIWPFLVDTWKAPLLLLYLNQNRLSNSKPYTFIAYTSIQKDSIYLYTK